jgi:flagellar biosynthesis protein FlhB
MIQIDLQFFSQEKTEKATPKRRQDARQKGQVAKSPEVSSAVILLFVFTFLIIGGKTFIEGTLQIYQRCFQDFLLWDGTFPSTQLIFKILLLDMAKILAPFFVITLAAGVFSNYIQSGFLFSMEALKLNLEKIDPIKGVKRLISLRSLVELVKSFLKIVISSGVAFWVIWRRKEELFSIGQKSIWDACGMIGSLVFQLGIATAASLIVVAVLDFLYQRFEHEKQLRMSKQDIKDEHKKTEGDPMIKGKRRSIQRQLAMSRMMQEVPKADVIITNPTHFAVAILFDMNSMDAPQVIAKGKDHIALKIKEIAREHHIMTVENKPLARALFASVEIGDQIPEELFNAVGEILAYVYFQDNRYKEMMA